MIKSLRKRHLQIWALWAVLLPVGIIVAWMTIPKKVTQELLPSKNQIINIVDSIPQQVLSIQLHSVIEKEGYKIAISLDSLIGYFIIVTNKKELTSPSLLLYEVIDHTTTNIDKQDLLGRIDGKGSYSFPIKLDSLNTYSFVLYDIIKKQVIDSITYKSLPHPARMKEGL